MLLIAGIIFQVGAFLLFPAFILSFPQLIAILLNVGSLLVHGSFALLKGSCFKYFFRDLLCSGSFLHRFLGLAYYASMALTLYASLIAFSYLLTLGSMLLQFVVLMYYTCSNFPGGVTGLNVLFKFVGEGLKYCVCCCMNKE